MYRLYALKTHTLPFVFNSVRLFQKLGRGVTHLFQLRRHPHGRRVSCFGKRKIQELTKGGSTQIETV